MKYKKDHPSKDIALALGLDKSQVKRIKEACAKAYHSVSIEDFSIDAINSMVAPYIKSQEEAFYAASVIITDVLEANESAISKTIG